MNCRVVLVRPRDPNNIGAAARAMKNFGFHDLTVVYPHPPVWDEVVSGVNAMDVVLKAPVVDSLAEAIVDRTLVIGTVDPTRNEKGRLAIAPRELGRLVEGADVKVALVFGSEKNGLTNDDLSHCHRIMSIPTRPDCPSMNLGQAVAICCYELAYLETAPDVSIYPVDSASAGEVERALEMAMDLLRRADYIIPGSEPGLRLQLRRKLIEFPMTDNDVHRLCGALSKIRSALKRQE